MKKALFLVFLLAASAHICTQPSKTMHKKPCVLRFEDNFWARIKIIHHPTTEMMLSKNTFYLKPAATLELSNHFEKVINKTQATSLHIDVVDKLIHLVNSGTSGNVKLIFEHSEQPPIFIKISKQSRKSIQANKTGRQSHARGYMLVIDTYSAQQSPPTFIVNLLESLAIKEVSSSLFFSLLGSAVGLTGSLFTFFCRSKKTTNRFDNLYHTPSSGLFKIAHEVGSRMAFYKKIDLKSCLFADLVKIVSPLSGVTQLAWIEPAPLPHIFDDIEFCCFNAPFSQSLKQLTELLTQPTHTPKNVKEIALIAPPTALTPKYLERLALLKQTFAGTIKLLIIASAGTNREAQQISHLSQDANLSDLNIPWTSVQIIRQPYKPALLEVTQPTLTERVTHNETLSSEQTELAEIAARYSSIKKSSAEEFQEECKKIYALYTPEDKNAFPADSHVLIYDEITQQHWTSKTKEEPITVVIILSDSDDAEKRWKERKATDLNISLKNSSGEDEPFVFHEACQIMAIKTKNPFARYSPGSTDDESTFLETSMLWANSVAREESIPQARGINSFYPTAELLGPYLAKALGTTNNFFHSYVQHLPGITISHERLRTSNNDPSISSPLRPDLKTKIPESTQLMSFYAPSQEAQAALTAEFATGAGAHLTHLIVVVRPEELEEKKCRQFIKKLPKRDGLQVSVFVQDDPRGKKSGKNYEQIEARCKKIGLSWCIQTNSDSPYITTISSWKGQRLSQSHENCYFQGHTTALLTRAANLLAEPKLTQPELEQELSRVSTDVPAYFEEGKVFFNNILVYDENTDLLSVQDENLPISHALIFRKDPAVEKSFVITHPSAGLITINRKQYQAHYLLETYLKPHDLCDKNTSFCGINKDDLIQLRSFLKNNHTITSIPLTDLSKVLPLLIDRIIEKKNISGDYRTSSQHSRREGTITRWHNWWYLKKIERQIRTPHPTFAGKFSPATASGEREYLKNHFPAFFADYQEYNSSAEIGEMLMAKVTTNTQSYVEQKSPTDILFKSYFPTRPALFFIEIDEDQTDHLVAMLNVLFCRKNVRDYFTQNKFIILINPAKENRLNRSTTDKFHYLKDKGSFCIFENNRDTPWIVTLKESGGDEICLAPFLCNESPELLAANCHIKSTVRAYLSNHYAEKQYCKLTKNIPADDARASDTPLPEPSRSPARTTMLIPQAEPPLTARRRGPRTMPPPIEHAQAPAETEGWTSIEYINYTPELEYTDIEKPLPTIDAATTAVIFMHINAANEATPNTDMLILLMKHLPDIPLFLCSATSPSFTMTDIQVPGLQQPLTPKTLSDYFAARKRLIMQNYGLALDRVCDLFVNRAEGPDFFPNLKQFLRAHAQGKKLLVFSINKPATASSTSI